MPAARSPVSVAISRHRAESAAPPMRAAPSDAWMTPVNSTDPTYSDPAAAARWLADVVAKGKASAPKQGSDVKKAEDIPPETQPADPTRPRDP